MASERAVIAKVRLLVDARDGYCRIAKHLPESACLGACSGSSQWAHLGQSRRCYTRKMDPTLRHTVEGTVMLCARHHALYDGQILGMPRMQIEELTSKRAEGPLAFLWKEHRFEEVA